MPNLLNDLHDKSENLKGSKLILVFTLVVLVSMGVGIFVDKTTRKLLNKNEPETTFDTNDIKVATNMKEFEGKVVYVDPRTYPLDEISYYLERANGDNILLTAKDAKLTVVENLYVKVYGKLVKSKEGEDLLIVEKVIIRNSE